MAEGVLLLILICFHLLLFRRFYFVNPYVYATSEALEQGFASSQLLGRHLRASGLFSLRPVQDHCYYPDHSALPFLSTYYWPHRLQAWLGSWLPLNQAWWLYSLTMVLHFLMASLAVQMSLSALGWGTLPSLFGSITISYLGYAMKQNSCIVYTAAWVPIWVLACLQHSWALSGISLGMMLTAGYWPIALYTVPLGCLAWLLR